MAKRRKKRWTQTQAKAPKQPRKDPEKAAKKRKKPSGIFYDNIKSTAASVDLFGDKK